MVRRAVGCAACVVLVACGQGDSSPNESCTSNAAEALTSCPKGATVKGVDVSTYNGTVNWSQAKAAGIALGFARISDGTHYVDGTFAANWKAMKSAGVIRGAYQFWRASQDPTAQAKLVESTLQAAGGLVAGDLPIVMDIETSDGMSASTIEARMKTWLSAVQAATGRKPIIYTSIGTYPIKTTTFSSYPLWVANYGATCPSMPIGWSNWVFWQNSESGSVHGISGGVDMDEFNGSLAELRAFAGGGATPQDGGVGDGGAEGPSDAGTGSSGGDSGAGAGASDAGATMGAGGSGSGGSGGSSPASSCGR